MEEIDLMALKADVKRRVMFGLLLQHRLLLPMAWFDRFVTPHLTAS